jgi:hypothetical protein
VSDVQAAGCSPEDWHAVLRSTSTQDGLCSSGRRASQKVVLEAKWCGNRINGHAACRVKPVPSAILIEVQKHIPKHMHTPIILNALAVCFPLGGTGLQLAAPLLWLAA